MKLNFLRPIEHLFNKTLAALFSKSTVLNNIHRFVYCRLRRKSNKIYGYIYMPSYPKKDEIIEGTSNLYNEYGEKLEEFFLHGKIMYADPYRCSRYFIFDRYNYGLKTHFYSHRAMLETFGNPDRKYGILREPPTILPKVYQMFDKFKGLEKEFDAIFTYYAPFLEKFDNAKFVPLYATTLGSDFVQPDWYLNKTKDISMLSSDKLLCELHKYRYDLAWKCKKNNLCDTFGTFDGGHIIKIQNTLKDYRFSIQIENDVQPYWFTERLIASFANQTIPIYLGATEVDKFFNTDGIIQINKKTDIEKVLKSCTKEEYESRIPAIIDNYNRAKKYTNPWDYMYEHYFIN